MDNDDLTELWSAQVRQKVEQLYEGIEVRFEQNHRRFVELGLAKPVTFEDHAKQAQDFITREVAEQLPFAIQLGRESNTTGPLTDDQLSQAGLQAAQHKTLNILSQFEERLQNAAPTMNPQRRQFAEAFLAMSKQHTALMDERLVDNTAPNENDLESVADQIAGDLDKLTQGLQRQFEDRLQNDPTLSPERRQFGEAYLALTKRQAALRDRVRAGELSEEEAMQAYGEIAQERRQLFDKQHQLYDDGTSPAVPEHP